MMNVQMLVASPTFYVMAECTFVGTLLNSERLKHTENKTFSFWTLSTLFAYKSTASLIGLEKNFC